MVNVRHRIMAKATGKQLSNPPTVIARRFYSTSATETHFGAWCSHEGVVSSANDAENVRVV